jgi:translocation and assembly module TamB
LGEGCWASGDSRLCLAAERDPQKLAATVDLQSFALAYLQPLLPVDLDLQGLLRASVSLRQPTGKEVELQAQLDTEDVSLHRLPADNRSAEPVQLLALDPAQITVRQNRDGLHASLAAPFTDAGGLKGQIDMPADDASFADRPLRGVLDFNVPDMELLTTLSPELQYVAGVLRGQLKLDGSINALQTQGRIELRDGVVQLATPGLHISAINVDAHTTGPQALQFSGEARSGNGTIALAGSAQLASQGAEADINIKGDAFQVFDTPDARVFVSPDLDIVMRPSGTRITGEVGVPRADITPRKLPSSAVSVSSDQIIIRGDSAGAPVAGPGVEAKVRLSLGDAVRVDGFGFMGRLTGSLLVEQAPNRPTLGTGELNIVDGEYRAYGQGLVIEEGNVLFVGGPVDQPGIQVRAVRRPANGILVGVRVRGAVEEPEFSLFSEPAMSQTEALSWLVLGRPLAGSSEGQGDMLAQAATMLGIKGGNYLADRFGDNLGVDSIGFETGSGEAGAASDVNQAALVIGKYLSPDLFVSYGIGLFDSISTIKLDYSLSKNWSLSTESSTETSGGDVNYVIER